MKTAQRKEFGDFQTPVPLAQEVCEFLRGRLGEFEVLIEPTCGVGAFLLAGGTVFPKARLLGYDINEAHLDEARRELTAAKMSDRLNLITQDFFTADWPTLLSGLPGRLLLVGNPPWVTNSEVSALGGANVPIKNNFQGHRGLAARTGKANFDISEWMLIKLIEAAKSRPIVIAVLCKTATARKVLRHAWQNDGKVTKAALYRIDAAAHFGVSVDACLFVAELGTDGPREAELFASLRFNAARTRFGLAGQDMVADLDAYQRWRHLEGFSPYRWRSGIKHDCVSVMELTAAGPDTFQNQLGETVSLEPEIVYPFLKCTPLSHGRLNPDRWLILTQKRVGEPTGSLAMSAPKAWEYLQSHAERFAARKSSIYLRGESFALFGVGDYALMPWKVAVSGLHRPPRFRVVAPFAGKPVLFDDTCYFISFETQEEAEIVAFILNSKPCTEFLQALSPPEAKRPVTVDLLQRLNIREMAVEVGCLEKWEQERNRKLDGVSTTGAAKQLELVMEVPPPKRRRKS